MASRPVHEARSDDQPGSAARADGLVDVLLDTTYYVKLMGEAALADTPLSLLSSRILATVLGEPGITVAELSRRIPKTQQMVSHVVAELGKLGLIDRRLGSGRGIGLYATAAGRRTAKDAQRRERELDLRLRALLGEARYRQLEKLAAESRTVLRGT